MSRSLRRWAALLLAPVFWVVGCTGSASPSPHASPRVVPPPAGAVFDYQIGGAYPPAANVRIVDRDRTQSPVSGRYNICYVNALQTQSDEPGQSRTDPPYGTTSWWVLHHPSLLVRDAQGRPVVDPDWDEAIFDVSTSTNRAALLAIQRE